MIRTFVAVELDPVLRHAIGRLQDQLKDRVQHELLKSPHARLQWVRPESIHLTLKFLGDVEEARVETICRTMAEAIGALPPLTLIVQGVGAFPTLRAPRVLWLGVSSDPGQAQVNALTHLAGTVDQALHRLGFPLESRPFSPHFTLARIKERPHEIGKALNDCQVMTHTSPLGTLIVRTIALIKSELTPSGSRYTRLCELPLSVRP
ncbi:MAG TPA: RNA 2',3'-cyclic phosphodiesterase [Nitrospiraceae bacterium]|nr:RNA 2',3'-cyclic phosphodiesterase [Nitrospiraceae bacterium]